MGSDSPLISCVKGNGINEYFISAVACPDESAGALLTRALDATKKLGAAIVHQDVFANVPPQVLAATLGKSPDWPITWLHTSQHINALAATCIHAVVGGTLAVIAHDGAPAASVFSDAHVQYCRVAGMCAKPEGSKVSQAQVAFEAIEQILTTAGLRFCDVARTWLYLDDILSWYAEFNTVRDTFFRERHVFEKSIPASTGCGARNSKAAALQAGALAIRALSPEVKIKLRPVLSPLQCPALDYKRSFSRAMELETPTCRRVWVSGTASIDAQGNTLHPHDIKAQIERTLDVVQALLQSRGLSWGDTVRAVGFFRDQALSGSYAEVRRRRGLPEIPIILTQSMLCRDDLLFELELDAAKQIDQP